jgi:DNA invertase Pin-like site-specific DNA recombinase
MTELDRLGRSTGEASVMMDELIRRGVALRVLALPCLDITTNDGRLIADSLASLAVHQRRRAAESQAMNPSTWRRAPTGLATRRSGRRWREPGQPYAGKLRPRRPDGRGRPEPVRAPA